VQRLTIGIIEKKEKLETRRGKPRRDGRRSFRWEKSEHRKLYFLSKKEDFASRSEIVPLPSTEKKRGTVKGKRGVGGGLVVGEKLYDLGNVLKKRRLKTTEDRETWKRGF